MIDRFFGVEARDRIAAAVREAEAASTGQIVPVVVEQSARYPQARFRGALAGAALVTALALALHWPLSIAELPLLQIAAGVVGALLALWGPAERLLTGHGEVEAAVRDRAVRAFQENGLHRTAHGTGVLVFASLVEHRAVVLGDHGIHAKMGDAAWQRTVDALTAGMRRGDPAAGFCEAIALCGTVLAEHFPRGPGGGQGNELGDALRSSRT